MNEPKVEKRPCRAAQRYVVALDQRLAAARALQALGQRVVRVAAMVVQQLEQLQHGGGGQARVLLRVEPHALAGEAQVQLQRASAVRGEAADVRGLAAGRAARREGHGGGDRSADPTQG
jgi:hypothetical protein